MMAAASTATAGSTVTTSFLRLSTASSAFASTHRVLTPAPNNYLHVKASPSTTARKWRGVFCSIPNAEHGVGSSSTGRREAMLHIAISAVVQVATTASVSSPAQALDAISDASAEFRIYSDDANKYKISIPQDWQVGAGETDGIRSITAFYPEATSSSNVSVIITGIGPDFTRLESFGKIDEFAERLVNELDRSWQRPPGVAAKLIDCKASNGLYYIEYTLQQPGESRRHIYSAIGMAKNGWYNRLYTVTGQFVEDESDNYGSKIQKAVKSFRLG